MKYPDVRLGTVEAVWNKLGGEEGVERFLREGFSVPLPKPTCSWREVGGVIYFTLPRTRGRIGSKWIERLVGKGLHVGIHARRIISSAEFLQTEGLVFEIAVVRGVLLMHSSLDLRLEAEKGTFTRGRLLSSANREVACLIRDNFSDQDIDAMGLQNIVTMHPPVENQLLAACVGGWLRTAQEVGPSAWRYDDSGFAFIASTTQDPQV